MPRLNEKALSRCTDALQSLFAGGAGHVLLGQFKRDGTRQWAHQRVQGIPELLAQDRWEVTPDGTPVDLFARQHLFTRTWAGTSARAWKATLGHLWSLGIDLDCYRSHPDLAPSAVAELAIAELRRLGFPLPNLIDLSGGGEQGGFYLRWLICPVDVRACRYSTMVELSTQYGKVMSGIVQLLQGFGADGKAIDVCRLLRVPGSVNSKYLGQDGNGLPISREWLHSERVLLDQLEASLPPSPPSAPASLAVVARSSQGGRLSGSSDNRAVPAAFAGAESQGAPPERPDALSDDKPATPIRSVTGAARRDGRRSPGLYVARFIERINDLRGGICDGYRNSTIFRYVICLKAAGLDLRSVRMRAEALAARFRPRLDSAEFVRTFESAWKADPYRHSYASVAASLDVTREELSALGVSIPPRRRLADGSENPDYRRYRREQQQKYKRIKRLQNAGLQDAASSVREANMLAKLQKIADWKKELAATGATPTKSSVARHAGLAYNTVARYWAVNDNDEEIQQRTSGRPIVD